MKNNREMVLDLLKQCAQAVSGDQNKGVTTQYISNRLDLQRTNISSILNNLVRDGLVEKRDGRPVLYRISHSCISKGETSCFAALIGAQGSLKQAVQLAKAAILYPQHSLHTLIIGSGGSGKSYFAKLMHQFALDNRILEGNAPYVPFNCADYIDEPERMENNLLEICSDGRNSYIDQAERGILFISHAELLSSSARARLFHFVDDNCSLPDGQNANRKTVVICSIDVNINKGLLEVFKNHFTVSVHLPLLEERRPEERFSLIRRFLCTEARRSNKTLVITSEILIALLLYPCPDQVKQLKNDIKIACANAYVRGYQSADSQISLIMSDFPYNVRTGLLNFKKNRFDLQEIIFENSNYVFSAQEEMKTEKVESSISKNDTIYEWIDEKTSELTARGITKQDINTIISIDIENEFRKYTSRLDSQIVNKDQLSQLVEAKLINLVQEFIDEAARKFNRIYPVSVFYGLCLHLNATLKGGDKQQALSNQRIMEIVEKYKGEYALSMKFSSRLEKEYQIRFPIDEVIFITMFISENMILREETNRPVVLVAMHGDGVASSMARVVKSLGGVGIYSYDMVLDKSTQDAYFDLRDMVISIHKGKGILVLYDMGSLREIFEMIATETGIPIRMIEIPLTVLILDCLRKAMLENDVETLYHSVMDKYQKFPFFLENDYYRPKVSRVIVTLCMSGEGGARQAKSYIEKHLNLENTEIIPLTISDREMLLTEINKLHRQSHIICTVGTYDPQILGVPFIPMNRIFQCPASELESLLKLDGPRPAGQETDSPEKLVLENYRVIFEHLETDLEHVDMEKMKICLPKLLEEIETCHEQPFTLDQKISLLVHIACCIDRACAGGEFPVNIYREEILAKNPKLYEGLKRCFAPVEATFSIGINDDEYAYIISIMLKKNRG